MNIRNGTHLAMALAMLCAGLAATLNADDGGRRYRRRHQGRHEQSHESDTALQPVANAAYAVHCGACHFAYQPELLPAGSWRRILESADSHFGETVELDPDKRIEIEGYLTSHAADTSSTGISRRIIRCLEGRTPLRITDIPYIQREHHEISPQVVRRPSVGSWSNCMACHHTAENGVYDDDRVSIPN